MTVPTCRSTTAASTWRMPSTPSTIAQIRWRASVSSRGAPAGRCSSRTTCIRAAPAGQRWRCWTRSETGGSASLRRGTIRRAGSGCPRWRTRDSAGGRVIDVGAGEAPYRALFEARGAEYIGCDIDGEAQVRFLPGQPIPLADGRADLVTSFQVLEHVWDVGWYLGECRRLVAPSGHLLLSTHGVWPYHPHPTDYRRWTRPGLLGEIETAGFTIVEVDGLVGPLAWTTQIRLLAYSQAARRLPVIGGALAAALALGMNTRMVLEDRITPASVRQDHACVYLVLARPAGSP